MNEEIIVNARQDREIRKRIIKAGDYTLVPYEDSRCKITITEVTWKKDSKCATDSKSRILGSSFDGMVIIGDLDSYIDKDIEYVLQQMCCGEICMVTIIYKDDDNTVVEELSCKLELKELTEEQLISDWSCDRLHESAVHHKERGVQLVKEKRIKDAFRRFSKALKMLVAVEPIDPEVIDEGKVKEMIDLKVKLYNNLAHCQLQYEEYEAVIELCKRALKYSPDNVKALYRRCVAYSGLNMYEDAWKDIQKALHIDPHDKGMQHKANELRPKIEKINNEYVNVIKKMFV